MSHNPLALEESFLYLQSRIVTNFQPPKTCFFFFFLESEKKIDEKCIHLTSKKRNTNFKLFSIFSTKYQKNCCQKKSIVQDFISHSQKQHNPWFFGWHTNLIPMPKNNTTLPWLGHPFAIEKIEDFFAFIPRHLTNLDGA